MSALALVNEQPNEFDDNSPRYLARGDIQNAQARAANAKEKAQAMRDVAAKATKMAEAWEAIERQHNNLLNGLLRIN